LVTQNILRSGHALATITEPPDHVGLNYDVLCSNLGTCSEKSQSVVLNADAFALFYASLTPAKSTSVNDNNGLTELAEYETIEYDLSMTAIAEIESAIERLSPVEVKELAVWFEEYQQMINASAEMFSLYEKEEGGQ
jgi:hypothetical protein